MTQKGNTTSQRHQKGCKARQNQLAQRTTPRLCKGPHSQRQVELDQEAQKALQYTGKNITLKNERGEVANTFSQADTFAEYLANSHWCPPPNPYTGSTQPIHTDSPVSMQPVTTKELQKIRGKVKNHKAPGPDGITAEQVKYLLESTLLQDLLNMFNKL